MLVMSDGDGMAGMAGDGGGTNSTFPPQLSLRDLRIDGQTHGCGYVIE